ncbi:hypothetical protein HYV85_06745 [Candidatus Woesearchaeota archaeon]|nr:hypothetical protein [Candidatus Woesearchaeota archaeon]
MALYSPATRRLEDVVGSAQIARQSVLDRFGTVREIQGNWGKIIEMPEVAEALELQDSYRREGSELATAVSELVISKSQMEERRPTAIQHAWKVKALCLPNERHPYVATAAMASIDTTETGSEEGMRQQLPTLRLSYPDLTHSLHNERLEDGRVFHNSCQQPATLELVGKIHRLVFKEDSQAKEEAIIEGVASMKGIRRRGLGAKQLSRELALLVRAAGPYAVFGSTYEAFRQTRHRAVTIADLAKNAHLGQDEIPGLWPVIAKCFGPEISKGQLAANLSQSDFIRSLEDVVSEHIAPPIVVTGSRVKGASLGDKYLLMQYYDKLVDKVDKEANNTTWTLRGFMNRRGLTCPDTFSRPNPHDLVSTMLIVHGDAVTYHALELANQGNNAVLPPGEVVAVQKMNGLLKLLTSSDGNFTRYMRNGTDDVWFVVPPEGITDKLGKPTQTGYRSRWLILQSLGDVLVEFQMLSNLMDNMAELDPKQSHDLKKIQQMTMIDYLVSQGMVSQAEVYLARRMVTLDGNVVEPSLNGKRHYSFAQAK